MTAKSDAARDCQWVIVATGEGADARVINGDLHQGVHEFMCCCGKPWRDCNSGGVTEDIARIDNPDAWGIDEAGKPFTIWWEYETGRTMLFRLSSMPIIAHTRELAVLRRLQKRAAGFCTTSAIMDTIHQMIADLEAEK